MIAGNCKIHELTIANGATGELDLSTEVSTEKLLKINPNADNVRLLLTPSTSAVVATNADFLLLKTEFNDFELGRGLNRLSFYNGSGGEAKVSIMVLF
jgi:hypothetical protein